MGNHLGTPGTASENWIQNRLGMELANSSYKTFAIETIAATPSVVENCDLILLREFKGLVGCGSILLWNFIELESCDRILLRESMGLEGCGYILLRESMEQMLRPHTPQGVYKT